VNEAQAPEFARAWIDAWNAHDIDRVLSHYAEDFEMTSPFIAQMVGEKSCRLRGKPAVRAYWAKALQLIPDLRFALVEVLTGVDSLVIRYRGHRGPAAEVFRFGPNGQVVAASAHY
jgi:ketosteroid isomerase-like protein